MPNSESSWAISPDMLADFIESYQAHPALWEDVAAICLIGGEPMAKLSQIVNGMATKTTNNN